MKQQKLFSKEELLKYSKEVVQSVCACHSKNIAHCDIKPANFLVDKYGRLKIGDFGLSSVYDDQYTCDLFKGTIIYMAPEVFGSEDYNPIISDVWAVGVTLYLLATRKYPFFSLDIEELKKKIASGKFDETEVEDLLLRDVIIRCLDINPKYRITCSEILEMPYFKPRQLPEIPLSAINRINSNMFIVKPRISERKSMFALLKSSRLNVLEHRCHK